MLTIVTDPTYHGRVGDDMPFLADTSEIAFVDDPAICAQAARAEALLIGADTTTPAPVYVLRLGSTRYLVFNFRQEGRESFAYSLFDEHFNLKRFGR